MRGKVTRVAWASGDDESSLKAAYQQEKDHQVKPKLHLLWLVRQGHQIRQAAQVVGVDSRTGQRWIACYRKGGLDALRRRKRAGKGKASYLTPEQKQRLKAWANAGNLESVPDAVAFVAQEFGVTYSASGLYKLLVMLRLRKKMPRPQNAKASAQVQEAFKRGLRDWLLSVQSSSVTFCDEMRLGLHSQLRRRWCEIGVKLVQPQQMRFEWAWLSVCVDVTACRLTWCWQPNLKVASMLETLERFYQAGIRSLIWDNAPAHRAKVVRDTALAVGFLPPFSPELNPVERLFEEVRRHVEGRLYETLQDKVEAVERFLKTLAADTERLRRLIGWDWIIQVGAELKKSVFPEANQAATS